MKYLLIVLAVAFAIPSMAEEDAPKRMTSAEKKAALLEKKIELRQRLLYNMMLTRTASWIPKRRPR